MADITNGGVRRTDEGIVYVYGTASAANIPAGSIRAVGASFNPPALLITPTGQIVVRYI